MTYVQLLWFHVVSAFACIALCNRYLGRFSMLKNQTVFDSIFTVSTKRMTPSRRITVDNSSLRRFQPGGIIPTVQQRLTVGLPTVLT